MDGSGNAAHICFGYDGQRDESPWKIGSPGGGGWPQGIHYSRQDYGSVADKFYTVRALKYANRKILSGYHAWLDSYCEYSAINSELENRRFTAVKVFCRAVISSPENAMGFLSITKDNIGLFILCATTAGTLSFGVVGGIMVAMIFAGYGTFSYIYSIYES